MGDREILYAILATIGSGIVTILVWMGPAVKRSIDAHPTAMEALARIATDTAVQTRILRAMQYHWRRRVDLLLLVEDQPFDATFVENLCRDIVAKHHLTLVVASNLRDAEEFLLHARVVILDVVLPESDLEDIKAFITNVVPPVIVHSVNDYPANTFKHAAKVVKKWENADGLLAAVETVLSSTYPRARP